MLLAVSGGTSPDIAPGLVVAWGDDGFGQTAVPEGLMAVQVDTLSDHTVARTPEGGVVAWGRNDWGQCDLPSELHWIDADAGGSLLLSDAGQAVGVGWNAFGQCDAPQGEVFAAVGVLPLGGFDGGRSSVGVGIGSGWAHRATIDQRWHRYLVRREPHVAFAIRRIHLGVGAQRRRAVQRPRGSGLSPRALPFCRDPNQRNSNQWLDVPPQQPVKDCLRNWSFGTVSATARCDFGAMSPEPDGGQGHTVGIGLLVSPMQNGIHDRCECLADLSGDRQVRRNAGGVGHGGCGQFDLLIVLDASGQCPL